MASVQFDPSSLSKYGRLALVARNLVEGFLTGVHKSPYKGFSVEFAEHRQYYPGDEIRHIDWRAYGKTDRYYIKEYEEETNLKAHLLVDASGSMKYRGKHGGKFEYAQYIAASLAYLMLHQRDAVGLATHDTKIRQFVPPKANAKHLLRVLTVLEQTQPGGETGLAPLWHQLADQFKRRGLVVILSDCFEDVPPCCGRCGTSATSGMRCCSSTSWRRRSWTSRSRSGHSSATSKSSATRCWSIRKRCGASTRRTSSSSARTCATPAATPRWTIIWCARTSRSRRRWAFI